MWDLVGNPANKFSYGAVHFVVGRSWEDKISDMRQAMTDKDVDMLVVTGLDETACKLAVQ